MTGCIIHLLWTNRFNRFKTQPRSHTQNGRPRGWTPKHSGRCPICKTYLAQRGMIVVGSWFFLGTSLQFTAKAYFHHRWDAKVPFEILELLGWAWPSLGTFDVDDFTRSKETQSEGLKDHHLPEHELLYFWDSTSMFLTLPTYANASISNGIQFTSREWRARSLVSFGIIWEAQCHINTYKNINFGISWLLTAGDDLGGGQAAGCWWSRPSFWDSSSSGPRETTSTTPSSSCMARLGGRFFGEVKGIP